MMKNNLGKVILVSPSPTLPTGEGADCGKLRLSGFGGVEQQLFLLLFLLFASFTTKQGCKQKKQENYTLSLPAKEVLSASEIEKRSIARFGKRHTHMYASLKGSTEGERVGGLDFSGNIYWEKDSLIWITLRKFGFEGMRARITPSSVTILNRLEKTALIRDIQWLEATYGIVDSWSMLQAMLLNQPVYLPKAEKTSAIKDSLHLLTQREGDKVVNFLFSDGDFRLQRVEVSELRRQITVRCMFRNWAEPGASAFSSRSRELFFYSPDEGNTQLNLQFENVEFDTPRSVKFEIPEHYERI
jgi:Domain of unknown function (DUF4292)